MLAPASQAETFTIHPMRAITIVTYGGVEGLEVREVNTPPMPSPDSVRVRVHAAGLNRADILQRLGRYPAPQGTPKDIPGLEFAGEVESVGNEVQNWKPGQRVFGISAGGAQAQFIVVRSDQLVEIPSKLNWIEAASVPEVFITAHDALFTQAELQAGETLLVHAAGSGVGTAAIQLGSAAGAQVFGTSRTLDKLERAKKYGLSSAVVIEDDPRVFIDAVHEWTNGSGVNVILDLVGAKYLEANLASLARRGRMMLVGTTSGSKATLEFGVVMSKRLSLRGTVLRARSLDEKAAATRLFEAQVVPLLEDGTVSPVIDSVYKMEEVRAAHQRLESNESFGKVVLLID